jgi:enoyl-CoA hydratase/carnithine racemase
VTVHYEAEGAVVTVTIDRPAVRNAVDAGTAAELAECFRRFGADEKLAAAVLTGAGGTFCAGYDLKELATGSTVPSRLDPPAPSARGPQRLEPTSPSSGEGGPMGPTRLVLDKPVIAAIEGFAVAGGLELALWCDLRVAAGDATLGVFNRRFGVPLIDLGTIRLPRLIGHGRAMDLILTGRAVPAIEALQIGLIERLVAPGTALQEAQEIARRLAEFPQAALRADRRSALNQWSISFEEAVLAEYRGGLEAIASGEARQGARRFTEGSGRHGE